MRPALISLRLGVILAFLVLGEADVSAQPPTRERGHFSIRGDSATVLAIDPGVKFALVSFQSGTICVFPADQRFVTLYSFPIHKKSVTGAAFLPDAEAFLTCSLDGTIRKWKTDDARRHHKAMEDSNGDGKPEVPKPIAGITAHSGSGVTCLAVSPDGSRAASGGSDGTIKIWDTANLKLLAALTGAHPGAGGTRSVQFSPDGNRLASGGGDRSAKIWDLRKEKPELLHKLDGHEGPVLAVAFDPTGSWLATGSGIPRKSGLARLWELGKGKPAARLEGHDDVVTCLVFHPKTRHLATGSADKKIRVWDLDEQRLLYSDEHPDGLRTLVITPDGQRFGSCSDSSVRWWVGFGPTALR